MFDRPSFDPRYSHGQQAGGSVRRQQPSNGIPAMFLPNYSGDGQGRAHSKVSQPVDGQVEPTPIPGDGELPLWSGDGRRQVANPLMPIFQANHRSANVNRPSGNGHNYSQAGRTIPPQVHPATGDGRSTVDVSSELSMTVNAPTTTTVHAPAKRAEKPSRKRRAKRASGSQVEGKSERSEMWKLVALVVIFLIWISTASTLLFLYMDRYLFP